MPKVRAHQKLISCYGKAVFFFSSGHFYRVKPQKNRKIALVTCDRVAEESLVMLGYRVSFCLSVNSGSMN